MTYFSQLIKKSSIVSNPTFDIQKDNKFKDNIIVESTTSSTTSHFKEFEEQKINDQSLSDFNDYNSSDKITENKPIKTQKNIINTNPKNNIKKEPIKQQDFNDYNSSDKITENKPIKTQKN